MADPIRSVTIVGGGTAGWLAALILNSGLSRSSAPEHALDVTLIESPDIPTVGVGEATVPNMPRTLIDCGISEAQFFKACNSSFKLGVLFDNWNVDREGKPICYLNSFDDPPVIDGMDLAAYMLRYDGAELDFAELCGPNLDLIREKKGPRGFRAPPFSQEASFAYHLDAGKFAGLLRDVCTARGVTHILDNLQGVEQDERGYVTALTLQKSGRREVELVLDCTGFRGLIINEVLGTEFVSYADCLANDRAMAVQVPHQGEVLEPGTRSTALGAGWSWRVPLYNRVGTGYVFSSAHRTDEEARDEFMAHLGPAAEGLEPRVIPMRVGRNREAWVKNVIAVGLAGGFIEPLESTAIHMVDMSIRHLMRLFPDTSYPEPVRKRYNQRMERLYDEVRDFICLHYALGNRTDTQYWIDVREELSVPDSLAENLELWRHTLPSYHDMPTATLFSHRTYQAVLMGKRVYEAGYAAQDITAAFALNEEKWWGFVADHRQRVADFVDRVPDHRQVLRDIRGELSSRERRRLERGEMPDPVPQMAAEMQVSENSLL